MVTVTSDAAARLLSRQCSTDDETVRTLLVSLRRSLAEDAINDDLYDDLNAVLDEYARPGTDEARQIAWRLRESTESLLEVVPYLAMPYPVNEVRHLVDLRDQWPHSGDVHGYVVRLALAFLDILDAMGEGAP